MTPEQLHSAPGNQEDGFVARTPEAATARLAENVLVRGRQPDKVGQAVTQRNGRVLQSDQDIGVKKEVHAPSGGYF